MYIRRERYATRLLHANESCSQRKRAKQRERGGGEGERERVREDSLHNLISNITNHDIVIAVCTIEFIKNDDGWTDKNQISFCIRENYMFCLCSKCEYLLYLNDKSLCKKAQSYFLFLLHKTQLIVVTSSTANTHICVALVLFFFSLFSKHNFKFHNLNNLCI